jgi:NADPH:quinone reductase-like Zn-dependent oxidoreductase
VYHYVFDTVGKSRFRACKRLLRPKGVYLSSELGWMMQNIWLALVTPLFRGRRVAFPFPADRKRSVLLIAEMLRAGTYRAVIDRTYPLEEIVEAFRYVETEQKIGNVVVAVTPS